MDIGLSIDPVAIIKFGGKIIEPIFNKGNKKIKSIFKKIPKPKLKSK